MDDCELIQLSLRGYQFTWERGKGSAEWMEERLDKVFATVGWSGQQEGAFVENILTRASDHSALYLSVLGEGLQGGGVRKFFKFEMAWLLDQGCREVVETAWQEGKANGSRDQPALAEFRRIEDQLARLEAQEDVFWRQRAKQHWLKGADANTKFYHRSIALCNVIYNIMVKVLANRMKPLLGDLISKSQSAFIPNRLITYDILVAAEVGHYLHRKHSGLVGWGALKLDIAKAYDMMEWPFLRRMLVALGFAYRWVDLIMLCVTTVSYSFLLNGVPSGQVVPTRRLRQGDPLSPFLFIICAEVLSLLLQQAQAASFIHKCRVARGVPRFPICSLLMIAYFSLRPMPRRQGNTTMEHWEEVAALLGVTQAPNFGKYLVLPAFVGRNRRVVFSYIEDKIRQRVGSWNKKLLSQAGKEVLLKSVAQVMPTFSMSVFLLPKSVCLSIERTMNRYWWGTGMIGEYIGRHVVIYVCQESSVVWASRLCWVSRHDGFSLCPGFSLLGFIRHGISPKTSFMDATIGNSPSYCWRSIMAFHALLFGGVKRKIGDRRSTLIWGHPWLPDGPDPMVATPMPVQLSGSLVSSMVDEVSDSWDLSIFNDIFVPGDVSRIARIPISPAYKDSWF
ncbi:uncharacterized protein LOC116013161 [Ipomoea triloba]|uniref:uncharacterized protein LOC116013161 n=1 Tax=Ipomoea triloba TaxID=35885 RepID=UPI00125CDFCB|nr:uncharacterized protein LOC116013161 [Ipomoea triloba]